MAQDSSAELQNRINQELAQFGRILPHTRLALIEAETGVKDFNKIMESGTRALGGLKDIVGNTIASSYRGEQGAKAFNGAIDGATKAADGAGDMLVKMGGPVGTTIGILLKVVGKLGDLAKAVAQQADTEYKAYQQLSKAGGATADGLTDVFNASQKLGVGVDGMQEYAAMFANYAKDLSTMSGSVTKGRAQFEGMIAAMEPFRLQLQNAGISQEAQNEGGLEYLKLITQLNRTKNKTAQQLAEDYKDYLIQEDKLTKATGVTRREREAAQRSALAEQRWAATLQKLRNEGNFEEAERLENYNKKLESTNPEAAKGMRATAAGFLDTEEAQKFTRSTLGQGISITEQVQKGMITDTAAVAQVNRQIADTYNMMGVQLGKIERNDSLLLSTTSARQAMLVTTQGITAAMEKSAEEGTKQGITTGNALDEVQQNTSKRIVAQQKTMLNLQSVTQKGVSTAAQGMAMVAEASAKATAQLAIISGAKPPEPPEPPRPTLNPVTSAANTKAATKGPVGRGGLAPARAPTTPVTTAPAPVSTTAPAPAQTATLNPTTSAANAQAATRGPVGRGGLASPPVDNKATPATAPAATTAKAKSTAGQSVQDKPNKKETLDRAVSAIKEFQILGLTNKFAQEAILKVAAKESGLDSASTEQGAQAWLNTVTSDKKYTYAKNTKNEKANLTGYDYMREVFPQLKTMNNGLYMNDSELKRAIETGDEFFFDMAYGYLGAKGKELGNDRPGDGYRYRGRGYVQITGKSTYQKVGMAIGKDLVTDPDLILKDPAVAAQSTLAYLAQSFGNGNMSKGLTALNSFMDSKTALQYITLNVQQGGAGMNQQALDRALKQTNFQQQLSEAEQKGGEITKEIMAAKGGIFQAKGARRSSKSTGFEILLKDGAVPVNIVNAPVETPPGPDITGGSVPRISTTVTKNITVQLKEIATEVVQQMRTQPRPNKEIDTAVVAKLQQLAQDKQKANAINSRLLRLSMN